MAGIRRRRTVHCVAVLAAIAASLLAEAAPAAFPGRNGLIALERSNPRPTCESVHGIFTVRPGGRDLRQLTSYDCSGNIDLTPVWSPDGKWILYREGNGYGIDPPDAVLIRGNGSGRTELGPMRVASYAWAPDGQHLSWDFTGAIFVGPLDNPRERHLAGGQDSTWSPDGRQIALITNCEGYDYLCTRLAVVDSATGKRIRTPIRNQVVKRPDWSPDGRRLVYLGTGRRKLDETTRYQVWVMRRDGRKRHRLTRDKHGVTEVAWSPDGRWIAFTRVTRTTRRNLRDLWLMRPDGSDKHRIARNVWDMSWQRRVPAKQ